MSDIDPAHARPLLVRAEEAETVGAGPNALRLLVDGGPRDGGVSAIRSTMAKDTDGPPPHFHRAAAEMFFVIEGGLHVLVGSEVHTARAGTSWWCRRTPRTPSAPRWTPAWTCSS
ncbi:cupin domain-containing protein [Nocardiopsis composta]